MRPDFIEFIGNARRPKGERFRHQLYVFLICLGISIFIWVLVRLSKEYIYPVNYQLFYSHLPENLRLTSVSDSMIRLNLKVQGFDFFSEQYFRRSKKYLEINLHEAPLRYLDNHLSGYLLSSYISREIISQNNFPIEVFSISPDTLVFTFEKRNLKRMQAIRINSIPTERINLKKDTVRTRIDSVVNYHRKQEITGSKKDK